MIIFVAITFIGISIGYTNFQYYPDLSQINSSAGALITYISFTVLSFLPTIIEVEENIRWSFYKSKI